MTSNGLPFISNITPSSAGDIIVVANGIRNAAINPINKIYVSIGGKYNARAVQIGSEGTIIPTNSLFQMFPHFLQTREPDQDDQCLIIAIDDFRNVQNLADNIALLQERNAPNTYIILCNMLCTKPFMTSFMEELLEFVRHTNVSNKNFMICNYIKFLNTPNDIERRSATSIPEAIQRVLDLEPNALYSDCFYDWFGYNPAKYNYVCCYKHKNQINYASLHKLEKILNDLNRDPSAKITVRNYAETNFWDKIYDITGYGIDKNKISMSLREWFIYNKNLKSQTSSSI
jgi:hypothetical protein